MFKRFLPVLALCAAALSLATAVDAQVVPNKATITFTAPTTHVDGTPITGSLSYNVYQGVGVGSAKTKVGTNTTTSITLANGLLSNTTYCYQLTSVEGPGPESAMSVEACKTFGASPPTTVTITVQ